MYYPNVVRQLGAIPGLVRLVSLILECISVILLTLHHSAGEGYTTDYMILSYLILVDLIEIVCLFGQGRGWPLPALPMLIAGDSIACLMLVCSRDWHGLWYWHGPYYCLRHEIGMAMLVILPWVASY